jgi:glycosyltransferase involved in cell wall biosynthesis
MNKDNNYRYTPLKEPVPITEQEWPDGTLPLVTTRTITYMHEPFIRGCIEGILMQKTTFPVEVVIHDDASTDKTAEIVREYKAKYPRLIQAIYQKENQFSKPGKGTMRADINKLVRGKYIALCEGDDYWTDPLKLQKQMEFLEGNEEFSACFTNADFVNEIDDTHRMYVRDLQQGDVDIKDIIVKGGYIYPTASLVFNKKMVNHNLQSNIPELAGDSLLIFNLAIHGKVYFIDQKTCVYRRWEGGIYSGISKDQSRLVNQWGKEIVGYQKLNKATSYEYSKFIKIKLSSLSLKILSVRLKADTVKFIIYLRVKDFVKMLYKHIAI